MFLVFCFYNEMDSGRPLTDMIIEGFTLGAVSNNIQRHNELQARDEVPTVVKRNQKRFKNFTVKEDEMLLVAWLNVTLDPVRGVNQSKKYLLKKNTRLLPRTQECLFRSHTKLSNESVGWYTT